MKKEVLFREFPWILKLNPIFNSATQFGVERLDSGTVVRYKAGRIRGGTEYPCDTLGYFTAIDGQRIGIVHPFRATQWTWHDRLRSFFNDINSDAFDATQSIEVAAKELTPESVDQVAYIVLLKQFLYRKDCVRLVLIKMPSGRSLRSVIEEAVQLRHDTEEKEKQEFISKLRS